MWNNKFFGKIFAESTAPLKAPDLGLLRVLGLIRIAAAYTLLHLSTFGHVLFAPLWYPESYWTPVSAALFLGGPPEAWLIQWICLLGLVFTVLLGLGAWTRYTGPLAFVFATMMSIISFSYGRLNHNTNTVPLLLLVFSFSDWGQCYSLDALWRRWRGKPWRLFKTTFPQWPIVITVAVFSLPYFTTALFKIIKGNFVEHGYIAALIKHKQLLWDVHGHVPDPIRALQNFMMANAWIGDILAWVTLAIEMFFFMALFSRESRVFMLAAALILHSSITLNTKVYFLEHMFMIVTLLTASIILLFRERYAPLARWFPKAELSPPAVPGTEPENTRLPWIKSVWAYAVGIVLLLLLVFAVRLPEIPMAQWLLLDKFHEGYYLFPTYTYIFDYHNDLIIAAVCWVYSFAVLSYFVLGFLKKAWQVGLKASHLQAPGPERLLIYDGDCGFCQRWVNWSIIRGADRVVRFIPGQRSGTLLAEVGLRPEEYLDYAIYIERDGSGRVVAIEKGAASINAVLRHFPDGGNAGFRLLGLLYQVDGIKQLQNLAYAWIAANRHRLAPGACQIQDSDKVGIAP